MDSQRLAADVTAVRPSRGRKSSTCQAVRHESVCVYVCDSETRRKSERQANVKRVFYSRCDFMLLTERQQESPKEREQE